MGAAVVEELGLCIGAFQIRTVCASLPCFRIVECIMIILGRCKQRGGATVCERVRICVCVDANDVVSAVSSGPEGKVGQSADTVQSTHL